MKSFADVVREFALSYPETTEDHPWGHSAFKVKGKMFVIMDEGKGPLTFSVKLPHSNDFALSFPGAQPTGYGMGKHAWVTFTVGKRDVIPTDVLRSFVDESFRAVAPKKVIAQLDGTPAQKSTPRRRRSPGV